MHEQRATTHASIITPELAESTDATSLGRSRRDSRDVALVNLSCAAGLPGGEGLDIPACLATLDRWCIAVERYTADTLSEFHEHPKAYEHHEGLFRFLAMVTLLKHPRGLGLKYQPSAVGNDRFADSRDDLLHGLLTRRLGTCASFPVLFVAIGRRLGYSMHLAIANGHVLCQWLNPDGTHLNLEGSTTGGGTTHPDAYYHTWPYPLTPENLATGRYLRPLTSAEELSLFLGIRGYCLEDNGRFDEAQEAYDKAYQAAPRWSPHAAHLWRLGQSRRRARASPQHPPLFPFIDNKGRSA